MKLSDKAQAALDKVVARFQAGDLSPVVEIAKLRLPGDAPATRWSYSNRVLAYAQTDSLDCRGFRQWEAVGRHVAKGARAGFILGPCTVVRKGKNGDGEDEERPVLVGFKAIPVFAYHQTEGDGDSAIGYEPQELPPLADVAGRLGVQVRWQPTPEDRLGDCAPDGSKMNIGTTDASVFFHELAHAVHARVNGGTLEGREVKEKEAVAEFTSCVLMELYGQGDSTGNSWRYIAHFHKDPLQAIVKALGEVEKILEVLEGGE